MFTREQVARRILAAGVAVTGVLASPTSAEIEFGGDTGSLYTYTMEEFAIFGDRPGSSFSTLGTYELGFTLGEKLFGQVNAPIGNFDDIDGTPTLPLAMDHSIGSAFGVNVITMFDSIVASGVGPLGFPDRNAIGEGALTVLFGRDQRVFAFDVVGASGGTVRMQFFSRQGALLEDLYLDNVRGGSFVFTSDARNIAAFTLTNNDPGGLVFDNFVFNPGYDNPPPGCEIFAPDMTVLESGVTEIHLQADSMSDPSGLYADYVWVSDCPGSDYDDITLATPTLWVENTDECEMSCTVSLVINDENQFEVCTRTLVFAGSGGAGLTCPSDLTVESDSLGNTADLDLWLQSAESSDPNTTNDFAGLDLGCGQTGAATVTWTATSGTGDCATTSECSAAFTIVDVTPPTLDVDTGGIVVEDVDCAGSLAVDLPEALATDDDGTSLPVEMNAPDLFTAGESVGVTYTATDECGNTASATVDVTVEHGAGIEVQLEKRVVGKRGGGGQPIEPLAGVTVRACTMAQGSMGQGAVVECDEVSRATTDDTGLALLGVPVGRYFVVADVDLDGDGEPEEQLLQHVGKVSCGQWKTKRMTLKIDANGNPIHAEEAQDE